MKIKNKNKNRMIVLFAAIMMFFMVVPVSNVLALTVISSLDFEGLPAPGQWVGSNNGLTLTTTRKAGSFNLSSTTVKTGSRSFMMGDTSARGWWNFSYNTGNYITNFSGWVYNNPGAINRFEMGFYNKTLGLSKNIDFTLYPSDEYAKYMIIFGYNVKGANSVSYINSVGASINIVTWSGVADWYQFYCSITSDVGDIDYNYRGAVQHGSACNMTSIYNDYRIDRMFVKFIVGASNQYFDDLNITISDSYVGGGTSGCLDTTGLTQVGHFGYCAGDVQTSHVYKKYNIPVSTTISGIELQVSPDQFSEDPDLTHYELSISGLNIGNPICFNPESYYYALQWDASYTVTNDLLTFDFYHSQKTGNRYWAIGESCSSTDDLDADGDISYQYTDYTVSYEWKWILFMPFHVPVSTPYTLTRNRDLSMRWWCSGFPAQETYNYPTTLGLHNYYSYNTTGYIYDVTLGYDTITGSYTLGTPALTYTLNLYHNNTKLYQYGFPMNCRYPGSGFGFAPNVIGKYRVQLNSTHALANVTAWVIGTFPPYKISTNPTVTNQYENYNVDYLYYHPQGYAGGAAMDYFPNMLNKFTDCFYQRYPLTSNQSASFLYSTNSSIAEYWGLYAYSNNLYSKLADTTHYIRIPSIFDNDIHPLLPNLVITGNNQNNNQMVLQGTHIFPGSHVSVYVNGIFLGDVGDSQYFTISYTPTKIGTFNATLVLFQNNSQVLIDYCSFTVSSSDTEPVPGGGGLGFDIRDFIPYPYDLFVCIGFIIFMVMLPTIIVVSLQKKVTVQINIPPMVMTVASIMSGFLGFILTVMWGLLSWVWFFAFVFVLIIILAIVYLTGSKSNDSE